MLTLTGVTVGHLSPFWDLTWTSPPAPSSSPSHGTESGILSLLDETLNLRDFHVMAPGALATRVWIDIERFRSCRASNRSIGVRWRPGMRRFLCVHKLATQKSPRPPTVRHKRRQPHSELQRRSYLLYLLERPPQIDISRSLAYASHVLENAKSPTMELLLVKQLVSELITTIFWLLEPIDDGPPMFNLIASGPLHRRTSSC
ncbi:hypothetical protein BKA70DRAFT_1412821 [Coprinopsis sp. MPI-PUGE-AT-0042]|nr:hypothetical protein BKA70DRAFT_1412821 [Coprinopsis sp. MPI-PUGE-AT-0042]